MRKFILIGALILVASCQEKKEIQIFEELEHPALSKGAQPFLFSDENGLIMSWTEKVNDSLHSLQFATYKDGHWTKPGTIASA